jgi:hypothetical protein
MKSLNSLVGTSALPRPRSRAAQLIFPALVGILCYHVIMSWIFPSIQHFISLWDQASKERTTTVSTEEFNWATVSFPTVPLVPDKMNYYFMLASDEALSGVKILTCA